MSGQKTDRTELTFSQAEGIDPLPQPSALGELSQRSTGFSLGYHLPGLRKTSTVTSPTVLYGGATTYIKEPWKTILCNTTAQCILNQPSG